MMNVIFDAEDQTPKSIRSTLKLPGLEPCTHGVAEPSASVPAAHLKGTTGSPGSPFPRRRTSSSSRATKIDGASHRTPVLTPTRRGDKFSVRSHRFWLFELGAPPERPPLSPKNTQKGAKWTGSRRSPSAFSERVRALPWRCPGHRPRPIAAPARLARLHRPGASTPRSSRRPSGSTTRPIELPGTGKGGLAPSEPALPSVAPGAPSYSFRRAPTVK